MKRSEMLDLMAKTIVCKDSGFTLSITEADILLKEMEKTGILPPFTSYHVKNKPEGFIQTWEEVNDYHNWEPEDEKK